MCTECAGDGHRRLCRSKERTRVWAPSIDRFKPTRCGRNIRNAVARVEAAAGAPGEVRADARVSGGPAEAGDVAGRADAAARQAEAPREAKVDHDTLLPPAGACAHGEVGGLEVAVQVADLVDGLHRAHDLHAEARRRRGAEAAVLARPAEFGEVLAEHLHDQEIESLRIAKVDETADVVAVLHFF